MLGSQEPSCRSIVLVSRVQATKVDQAMLSAASGVLTKEAPPIRLTNAIRQVHWGERVVDPDLVVEAFRHGQNPLTKRERELLEYLAKGADVRDIASALFLVPGTVRNYLSLMMTKIGARNRIDAVRIARERGWLIEDRPTG
jgi:two-component system response regulator DesR